MRRTITALLAAFASVSAIFAAAASDNGTILDDIPGSTRIYSVYDIDAKFPTKTAVASDIATARTYAVTNLPAGSGTIPAGDCTIFNVSNPTDGLTVQLPKGEPEIVANGMTYTSRSCSFVVRVVNTNATQISGITKGKYAFTAEWMGLNLMQYGSIPAGTNYVAFTSTRADSASGKIWSVSLTSVGKGSVGGSSGSSSSAAAKDGRYALFIIPLNPDGASPTWSDVELKGTENDFGMLFFFTSTTCNGWQDYNYSGVQIDWCRLYVLTTVTGTDARNWTRIRSTVDLGSYQPKDIAVIVDAALLRRTADKDWLREDNDTLIWSYLRYSETSPETDSQTGSALWRPIMPVRWYSKLPSWASNPPQYLSN